MPNEAAKTLFKNLGTLSQKGFFPGAIFYAFVKDVMGDRDEGPDVVHHDVVSQISHIYLHTSISIFNTIINFR